MARDETPPWELGQSFYNGGQIDTNNLGGPQLEGKEYMFEDRFYGTGNPIRVKVVRNVSGAGVNIRPGYLVTFKAGFYGQRVDGLAMVDGASSFPSDPNLPAAGVPNNDLFYIIIEGPTLVKTSLSGGAPNVVNFGDPLVAQVAATSGATTSGRVVSLAGYTLSATASKVGRAMSAATTANTNANLLMYVTRQDI